jgi:hypothetical protein
MSARTTYEAAVVAASAAKLAARDAANQAMNLALRQWRYGGAAPSVVTAANATFLAAIDASETTRQATVGAAKATLQVTGDHSADGDHG